MLINVCKVQAKLDNVLKSGKEWQGYSLRMNIKFFFSEKRITDKHLYTMFCIPDNVSAVKTCCSYRIYRTSKECNVAAATANRILCAVREQLHGAKQTTFRTLFLGTEHDAYS